jgi:hypothetical protein
MATGTPPPRPTTTGRRAVLRMALGGSAALLLSLRGKRGLAQSRATPDSFNALYNYPPMLGHVVSWHLPVLSNPPDGEPTAYLEKGDVVPIYGAKVFRPAPRAYPHNPVWFDIGTGCVHSSYVVPVREQFQEPVDPVGGGFWAEISVPYTQQHWEPREGSVGRFQMSYGAVFRVVERADDEQGQAWYRLYEEQNPGGIWWWVRAAHARKIGLEEFAPISPEVSPPHKRIVIDLAAQELVCTEYDAVVFSTRIASGSGYRDSSGELYGFDTPPGEHHVQRKTPARHMIGGPPGTRGFYNLPGVPWCTYFTSGGAAIHGTYWHNDFGRPRSHGCINVTSDAAKWIYRWTTPHLGPGGGYYYYWVPEEEQEAATAIEVRNQAY